MKLFTDYRLGARDVILLLEELHKRGYERLRLFGYVSPNGAAYRVHIAHRDEMSENGYELNGVSIWHSSVGLDCSGASQCTLTDAFVKEFSEHTDLLRAKAEDTAYVRWFGRVVALAHQDSYLSPFAEYQKSSIYQGYINTVGRERKRLPLPPGFSRPFTGTPSAQVWVESAAQLTRLLHYDQVNKTSVPYFERYLSAVAAQGRDWRERVVGYLHNSTEETDYSIESILTKLEGLAEASLPPRDRGEIERALRLLNHHTADSRESYIENLVASPLATAVKLLDLTHNMDLSQLTSPDARDYERLARYQRELAYLSQYLRPPTYLD